jgi:MurNAc alpha-1-phosphate uridylyltransferase
MDGMILAAGLGTRLRPLTEARPKALVEVAGVPMLERVARRMVASGVDRLIINVHHHGRQIVEFVESRNGFGVEVRFSHETERPLETGGGLKHARHHFRAGDFLVHNVDVISDVDLVGMVQAHERAGALATLAVQDRPSGRFLRFDGAGLQARVDIGAGVVQKARPARGRVQDRAFAGIHVIAPEIFDLISEDGVFSILVPYLRLSEEGYHILPHDVSDALWFDVGDPQRLETASRMMARRQASGDES